MKIVIFETEQWEAAACARLAGPHALACTPEPLRPDNVARFADAEVISPFVHSNLGAAVLARMPRLRLIATRSTGYDHVDLAYCREAAITVCNVPDYGDHTVAEHAFALLLALCRHIPEATERVRRGDVRARDLRGVELTGKTLGVIGAGRIGRRVLQIARGFGMRTLASDPSPDAAARKDPDFHAVSLPVLLAASDVISLHAPGGSGLHLSDPEFALMKTGALLINTARGGAVDPAALLRALSSGRLAGAGLDVIAEEQAFGDEAEIFRQDAQVDPARLRALLADHALVRLPNVLVTPHIAYNTQEAVDRITETTLGNIEAYAAGAARNVVTAVTPASPSPGGPT